MGAIPVFVDVDVDTWCISPAELRQGFEQQRIRWVLPVHLFGNVCDMSLIEACCAAHGAGLIEDAAQALGSELSQRGSSSSRRVVAFSFDARKQLPLGQGGMLITTREELAVAARAFRHCGLTLQGGDLLAAFAGINFLPSALHASLGISLLARVEGWNSNRRKVRDWLNESASLLQIQVQKVMGNCNPAPQRLGFLVHDLPRRQRILELARVRKVPMTPLYRPLHQHPFFRTAPTVGPLNATEYFCAHNICLELSPSEMDSQIEAARDVFGGSW